MHATCISLFFEAMVLIAHAGCPIVSWRACVLDDFKMWQACQLCAVENSSWMCLLTCSAVLSALRLLCRHQPQLCINIHIQWAGPDWLSSPEPGPGIRPEPAQHPP